MTLRRRLALTFVALTAAGCVIFAALSLAVINISLRGAIDAKLVTLSKAIADVVDDRDGRAYVDTDDIRQIKLLAEPGEHFAIVDHDGRLIYGERVPDLHHRRGFRFATAAAFHRGHDDGVVTTWRDERLVDDVIRVSLLAFFAAGLALGACAFFFSGLYARAILTPVQRVAQLAERIESSDLSTRLNARGRDELARLCASFDRMLERLESSFDGQRRFVADASHELRAPLAVVRAEIDLALRRNRTPEEYRDALASIDHETSRLEELVDSLLQTMRQQALVGKQAVDVAHIVSSVADRMQHAARALTVNSASRLPAVAADAQSLERAISAVLHNALTHGGGHVDVAVESDDEQVRVRVADSGPGFTDDALAHATERFWRGDTARSRGGTGLGLSIARVLVEAHGGSLTLANGKRGGAIVTVTLPRSMQLTTA